MGNSLLWKTGKLGRSDGTSDLTMSTVQSRLQPSKANWVGHNSLKPLSALWSVPEASWGVPECTRPCWSVLECPRASQSISGVVPERAGPSRNVPERERPEACWRVRDRTGTSLSTPERFWSVPETCPSIPERPGVFLERTRPGAFLECTRNVP